MKKQIGVRFLKGSFKIYFKTIKKCKRAISGRYSADQNSNQSK
jgi:hypothetical protein